MPIFLILSCEIGFFSFLIGAYFHSVGIGFITLGGSGLILYGLFQQFFSLQPLVWSVTFLGGFAILLWTTYIDQWFGTSFIALLFSLLTGTLLYFMNNLFLRKHHR